MPSIGGGGASSLTGANIVDGSIGVADLATSAQPAYVHTDADSLLPIPNFRSIANATIPLNTNTTLCLGQVILSAPITINKISFNVPTVTVAGAVNIAIFSSDGATRHINGTTASIGTTGLKTLTLGAAVRLPAGVYWIGFNPVGTCNIDVATHSVQNQAMVDSAAGEPVPAGTVACTASTMPTTITPTAPTYNSSACVHVRLDN